MFRTVSPSIIRSLAICWLLANKHVEFYSKNKFEKLVHLVCFITKIGSSVIRADFFYEYWFWKRKSNLLISVFHLLIIAVNRNDIKHQKKNSYYNYIFRISIFLLSENAEAYSVWEKLFYGTNKVRREDGVKAKVRTCNCVHVALVCISCATSDEGPLEVLTQCLIVYHPNQERYHLLVQKMQEMEVLAQFIKTTQCWF